MPLPGGGRRRILVRAMSAPLDPDRTTVTVLAVDDQPVFRHTARELIAATEGFQQIAEADSGAQALVLAAELHPDLVLVDARMPGMDGIETTRRLIDQDPSALVVLVSLEAAVDLPAARAGIAAAPHVRKQDLSPRTLRALWRAHGHRRPARHAGPDPAV
jgi:DNA-binding NarL/FixJ family response regulator